MDRDTEFQWRIDGEQDNMQFQPCWVLRRGEQELCRVYMGRVHSYVQATIQSSLPGLEGLFACGYDEEQTLFPRLNRIVYRLGGEAIGEYVYEDACVSSINGEYYAVVDGLGIDFFRMNDSIHLVAHCSMYNDLDTAELQTTRSDASLFSIWGEEQVKDENLLLMMLCPLIGF